MIKNPCKVLNEIDLDQQLAETQKLKQCIVEFSSRLQKAQERLLEDDTSKKIKASFELTQKIHVSHSRRHNSHNPAIDSLHSRKPSRVSLNNENLDDYPKPRPEFSNTLITNVLRESKHQRKVSDFHENPQKKFESLELPISPSLAYRYFKYLLSPFEQGEVLEYNEIYYLGLSAEKIKNYSVNMNYGYDDERGDYRVVIGDHVAYRYEIVEVLGKGSFGQVVKVFDHKNKSNAALKIIRNKPRFHQQAEVEVNVLKGLIENDKAGKYNVVHIKDSLQFRNHSCILFEMLGQSLYDLLKSSGFKGIGLRYIKRYSHQVLQSLYLLSKLKLIHCDLKPENILLTEGSKSSVKVIDFGSSCYKQNKIYSYIQSRFYRAPEILLGLEYSESIDIWSLGCILIELYTGFPAFPGESEADLFTCMMEVLGVPPMDYMNRSQRKSMYLNSKNEPRIVPNSKGKKRYPGTKTINDMLEGCDIEFIDLVERKNYLGCLQWEPDKRISPREALEHIWFKSRSKGLCTAPVTKGHRYHLSDTQFNHSSYNRIFHPPQTGKYHDKGVAF